MTKYMDGGRGAWRDDAHHWREPIVAAHMCLKAPPLIHSRKVLLYIAGGPLTKTWTRTRGHGATTQTSGMRKIFTFSVYIFRCVATFHSRT